MRVRVFLKFIVLFFYCLSNAQTLESLKEKLKNEQTEENRISVHHEIAEAYSKSNRYDSAKIHSDLAYKIALSSKQKNLIEKSRLYNGMYLYEKGNYDEAINTLEQSLRHYTTTPEDSLYLVAKKFLGLSYIQQENLQKALVHLLEIEGLIPEKNKVPVLSGIATIYSKLGDNETALKYLNENYRISKKYDKVIGLQETYNSLAIIYETENNYEKALEYYKENLSLCKSINDEFCIIMTHNNLAGLYFEQGKTRLAINEIENILPLLKKVNNDYITVTVYVNYANYLQELGLVTKAAQILDLFNEEIDILNAPEISIEKLHVKAKIAFKNKNYKANVALLNEALRWIKKHPNPEKKLELLLDRSTTLEYTKEYKNALSSYKQYTSLLDSLNTVARYETSETLKQKFEVKRYQDKALAQKQETALLRVKQKNNTYKISLLFLAVISLIVILVKQKQRANSRKRAYLLEKELQQSIENQLNQQVKFKNKQITDYALHIREKNDLLKHLSNQVKKIRASNNPKSIMRLANDLILFINNQLQLNEEKITFNKDIKQTEASFLYKLKSKFPQLSERELQIVTYIRLQMSSKQISNKLNINPQSVNNHRLRIRKKLNLSKNEKLNTFLERL